MLFQFLGMRITMTRVIRHVKECQETITLSFRGSKFSTIFSKRVSGNGTNVLAMS